MRIALFHNVPSGGAKRTIYEWVRRLSTEHVIDAYSLTSADHQFCDIRPFAKEHHVLAYVSRPLLESPLGRLNQWQRWRDLRDLTRLGRSIARRIDKGGYDVVFAHTCQFTHVPLFLQFLETPAVYYLHEPVGPHFVRTIHRPYFRINRLRSFVDRADPLIYLYRSYLATAQRRSIERAALLLANSRFTQHEMTRGYEVQADISYNGVDHETFRPIGSVVKEYSIISVGELTARKGFDFVVEAIGHIPLGKRPSVKVVSNMVNEMEKDYLQNLAERYGVRWELLTNLDSERLAVEYNRALLCVYAPVLEPLGVVPLEAMACEIPVVGVAEGGITDTIIDGVNGRLVARDPVACAKVVEELLDDSVAREELGRQARDHVLSTWSWEKSTKEIERHLFETASRTAKPSTVDLPA
jgi:glycosyltransferase involved in cell wall biosynthesis